VLLKRKNTYYFRWQIPQDLRPYFGYELIRSLRTKNQSEALLQLSVYAELVQLIKETRRLMLFQEISLEKHLESIESIKLRIADKSIALSTISQLIPMSAPIDKQAAIKLSQFMTDEFIQYKKARAGGLSDKAEGKYKGRKAIDVIVVTQAKELISKGMTKKSVAKQPNIGESILYKYLAQ
jgi:hypothetical protein